MQEDELRKIAEQHRKEKEEDKLVIQRARELNEKNKKDRAHEFGMTSHAEDGCQLAGKTDITVNGKF